MNGIERIAAERERQLHVEGWDAEHDSGHGEELAAAAACYALPERKHEWNAGNERMGMQVLVKMSLVRWIWPWLDKWWKPTERIRDLEKAGALCAAAIDSLLAEEAAREDAPEAPR